MKIAFIFPGQGSQYIGMGKDLYDQMPAARTVYEQADAALGFSLSELCFNGPEAELIKTANTQPAILTTSIACLELLRQAGIKADVVAGHSLGEYSALVAAGSINLTDAVQLVHKRGTYMQDAVANGIGGMAAILGLESNLVREACAQASGDGIVEVANYNCPGQVVISGEIKALEKAMELAKVAGAKRAIKLSVSGPFHSSLMKPIEEKLTAELATINMSDPALPLVANVSADYLTTAEKIKASLVKQVSYSVRWEESVLKMVNDGVQIFIEIGPGKVLSGLVKKIDKNVEIYNVEDMSSWQKMLVKMKEVI